MSFNDLLIRYFCPDAYADSITDIDPEKLVRKGINTVLLDLDNTLLSWRSYDVASGVVAWLKEAERAGFKRHIVSNSLPRRVSRLCGELGIPGLSSAVKPRRKVFLEALRVLGSKPEESVIIGDQLFTDVLGGKRTGLLTILVSPVDPHEFFTTKILRVPEKLMLAFFRRRGLLRAFS